ncbi:single-stranded DNA-binding protein [Naumannella huperziae]
MEARVTLTGRVGGPIEVKDTTGGIRVASFRLGSTPRSRRDGEWSDLPTTWLTVKCFGRLAWNVGGSLGKGEPVVVEGRLRTEQWQTKEGEDRERLVLNADVVGHDLNHGTANFRKVRVEPRQAEIANEEATAATDPALRTEEGERIDPDTGEIAA